MNTRPTAPTPFLVLDSRPIPLGDLTSDLREAIRKILDLLNAIRDDNQKRQGRQRARHRGEVLPWATTEEERTYRIAMIDGGRGTGKTSLLLTLLQNWHPAHQPSEPESANPQLFAPDDVKVRALPPLDFDPHPESLHAFAWIVLAFEPIASYLDQQRPHHGDGLTHRERWAELHKSALIGWTNGTVEHLLRGDLDTFVIDQQDGHLAWHRLEMRWTEFMDELVNGLVNVGQLPADGLLVLPVDDLDLHPSMAGQLLLAMRLLRHKRLVFLLNGDADHLLEVLDLELFQKAVKGARLPEGAQGLRFESARTLSRAIVDKLIPRAHRVALERRTLAELATVTLGTKPIVDQTAISAWGQVTPYGLLNLEDAATTQSDIQAYRGDSKPWPLPSPAILFANTYTGARGLAPMHGPLGASLHLLLSGLGLGLPPLYTWRDAANLRALFAESRAHPDRSSRQRLYIADELLRRARDSAGKPLFNSDCRIENGKDEERLTMRLVGVGAPFRFKHPNGSMISFTAALRLDTIPQPMTDSRPRDRALEALLSIWSFAHETPHPDVVHPQTMWSPLASTTWSETTKIGFGNSFRWPGLMPWPHLERTTCHIDSLLKQEVSPLGFWLETNFVLAGFSPGTETAETRLRQGLKQIKHIRTSPLHAAIMNLDDFLNWFQHYLPLLAAPEFGLLPRDQDVLLNFFSDNSTLADLETDWPHLREQWMRNRDESLYMTLHQHSHAGPPPDHPTIAEFDKKTGRISALKLAIREASGVSLWDKRIEGPNKARTRSKSPRPHQK